MITTHKGDLFTAVNDQSRILIMHGCNAKGVMGSGFALTLKQKYPNAYRIYHTAHSDRGLQLGQVVFHHDLNVVIANAVTQENYGRDANVVYVDYKAVERCCKAVADVAKGLRLPVHFPLIGAGLANGDWERISKIIDENIPDPIEKHLWVLE